jgi:hypothetical protein
LGLYFEYFDHTLAVIWYLRRIRLVFSLLFVHVRMYMKIYIDVLGELRGNATDFFSNTKLALCMFPNEIKYLKSELCWLTDLKSCVKLKS